MNPLNTSVLLIYTGGTIGMIENAATGALENFNFEQLQKYIPELQKFNFPIDTYQLILQWIRRTWNRICGGSWYASFMKITTATTLRHPARNGYDGLHCFCIKFYARRAR